MKAEFITTYPLDQLAPADYNPRQLTEEKFVLLQERLRKFGVISAPAIKEYCLDSTTNWNLFH